MPRFSANLTFLFNEVPFLDRFGEAAQAGFRAVEFAFGYDYQVKEIAARVAEHKLDVVLINSPPGNYEAGDRGLASLSGREHEFAASVVTALALRADAALPARPRDGGRAARRRRRRGAGAPAAHVQAQPALRVPGGGRAERDGADRADQPARHAALSPITQAEAHAIREEIAMANLKVQMDLYHAQVVEGDLTTKIRRWLPHIGHFQVAGVPGAQRAQRGRAQLRIPVQAPRRAQVRRLRRLRVPAGADDRRRLGWLYKLIDRRPSA